MPVERQGRFDRPAPKYTSKSANEHPLPLRWPENMPLPSIEDAEAAFHIEKQVVIDLAKKRKGKLIPGYQVRDLYALDEKEVDVDIEDPSRDSEQGLPPIGIGWPTAERVREVFQQQENPFETVRKLREAVPLANAETLNTKLRTQG